MIQPPPRNDRECWKSLALAAGVHLALVAALFFGVQWKSNPPAAVEIELWDRVAVQPPPPAPPPPEPNSEPKPEPKPEPEPPPPPKVEPKPEPRPEIAVKEEKKKKPEPPKKVEPPKKPEPPKKEEAKKTEPKKPVPPRPSFEEEMKREERQLDQQRQMREQAARADAEMRALSEARAEQSAAARKRGLDDYASKIRGKIRGNIVLPQAIQGNPEAVFEIVQLPSGEIVGTPRMKKSSGNPNLDAAIERAILKSSPLPKPDQPELFQRTLEIRYRPLEE